MFASRTTLPQMPTNVYIQEEPDEYGIKTDDHRAFCKESACRNCPATWFVSLETAKSIRRLVPHAHFRKMRSYFDDWGCLRCEQKGVMYGANGMCCRCSQKVQQGLISCLQKRHSDVLPLSRSPDVCTRVENAKVLFSDLVRIESLRTSQSRSRTIKP
jgi:hypothetical protein